MDPAPVPTNTKQTYPETANPARPAAKRAAIRALQPAPAAYTAEI